MSEQRKGTTGGGRRRRRFLSPSEKYEIWIGLVRGESTIAEAADRAGVDRSTVMKLRQLERIRVDYNTVRLHAGLGYVTPDDEHEGRGPKIRKARQAGLNRARRQRIAYHRKQRTKANRRKPHDAG